MGVIRPSSPTRARSTSAKIELHLLVSVTVGQDSSKRQWTTNADTHFLGSPNRPPIKSVYRRLPHDVIPAPNAKLITIIDPGMWMCVKNSTCQSKPLFLMSLGLEWGIIKHAVCAVKGQSHKRLWGSFFFLLFFVLFKPTHHLSEFRK